MSGGIVVESVGEIGLIGEAVEWFDIGTLEVRARGIQPLDPLRPVEGGDLLARESLECGSTKYVGQRREK